MLLTEHFSLSELTDSSTAVRLGIDNTPDATTQVNLLALCKYVLEPIRTLVSKPIHIDSGFRCKELNKSVNGAKNSYHVKGMAADIKVDGLTTQDLFDIICQSDIVFTECIQEFDAWVHIAYDESKLVKERLYAKMVDGKKVYSKAQE